MRLVARCLFAGFVLAMSGAMGAATACSSFGEGSDDDASKNDASTSPNDGDGGTTIPDGGTTPEAGPARCDPTKPFTVKEVDGVNTTDSETYAVFSEDERTIYFGRGAGPDRDIWTATRETADEAFKNAVRYAPANSSYLDDGLTFSPNGLLAVVATGRPSGNAPNLFSMKRPSTSSSFSTPTEILGINSTLPLANDNDPYLLSNKMYFSSDREKLGSADIYQVVVTATGFGPVTKVTELSSGFSDGAPVASQDDMEIFIASGRLAGDGGAGERAFHAQRPAPGMAFSAPEDVPELNEKDTSSIPSWLSADRCVLLFSTDRNGDRDIWVATRGN